MQSLSEKCERNDPYPSAKCRVTPVLVNNDVRFLHPRPRKGIIRTETIVLPFSSARFLPGRASLLIGSKKGIARWLLPRTSRAHGFTRLFCLPLGWRSPSRCSVQPPGRNSHHRLKIRQPSPTAPWPKPCKTLPPETA